MSVLPCNDECEVIGMQAEQHTDLDMKVEEVAEPISFPEIKAEPNEVSYVSLCHRYIKWLGWLVVCYRGLPT
jgi:hypothetical protein